MGKDGTKLTVSEMMQNKNVAGMGYEERLEIIRRLNEDLKVCGINHMTEEQMQDLAMDRTKIINYKKAQHFEKEQKKMTEFGKNLPAELSLAQTPLARSTPYIYDLSGTPEANKKNINDANTFRTLEFQQKRMKQVFEFGKAIDEADFYLTEMDDTVNFFANDMQEKSFLFETDYPYVGLKDQPGFQFNEKEQAQYLDKKGIFQNAGKYKLKLTRAAHPLYTLLPDLSADDVNKLGVYYTKNGSPELGGYLIGSLYGITSEEQDIYSDAMIKDMKEQGFLDGNNYGYICYNEKGEKLLSRSFAIDFLNRHDLKNGDPTKVKIERYKLDDPEKKIISSIELNYDDYVKRYNEVSGKTKEVLESLKYSKDPKERYEQRQFLKYLLKNDPGLVNLKTAEEVESKIKAAQESIINGTNPEYQKVKNADPMIRSILVDSMGVRNFNIDKEIERMQSNLSSPILVDAKKRIERNEATLAYLNDSIAETAAYMFGSKIDPSKGRRNFDFNDIPEAKAILEVQDKAAKIVQKPLEGMDEKDINYLNFATLTDENILKASYESAAKAPGSSLTEDFDPVEGGLTNLFENLIEKDDERVNMHTARLGLLTARTKADALLKSGDYNAIAKQLKTAFDLCVRESKNFAYSQDKRSIFAADVAAGIYKTLNKPAFKGMIEFTNQEVQMAEFLEKKNNLVKEHAWLSESISKYCSEMVVAGNDISGDLTLQNMIEEYNARDYLLQCFADNVTEKLGMYRTEFGTDSVIAMGKRELFENEKNFAYNPEKYVEHMKKEIKSFQNVSNFSQYKNYGDVIKDISSRHKSTWPKRSLLFADVENVTIKNTLQELIDKAATNPENKDFVEKAKQLSCFKSNISAKADKKDIQNRINEYTKLNELVQKSELSYMAVDDIDGSRYNVGLKSYFSSALQKAIANLENGPAVVEKELAIKNDIVLTERSVKIPELNYNELEVKASDVEDKIDEFEKQYSVDGKISKEGCEKLFNDSMKVLEKEIGDGDMQKAFNIASKFKNDLANGMSKEDFQKTYDDISEIQGKINERMKDFDDPKYDRQFQVLSTVINDMDRLYHVQEPAPEVTENEPTKEGVDLAKRLMNVSLKFMPVMRKKDGEYTPDEMADIKSELANIYVCKTYMDYAKKHEGFCPDIFEYEREVQNLCKQKFMDSIEKNPEVIDFIKKAGSGSAKQDEKLVEKLVTAMTNSRKISLENEKKNLEKGPEKEQETLEIKNNLTM